MHCGVGGIVLVCFAFESLGDTNMIAEEVKILLNSASSSPIRERIESFISSDEEFLERVDTYQQLQDDIVEHAAYLKAQSELLVKTHKLLRDKFNSDAQLHYHACNRYKEDYEICKEELDRRDNDERANF